MQISIYGTYNREYITFIVSLFNAMNVLKDYDFVALERHEDYEYLRSKLFWMVNSFSNRIVLTLADDDDGFNFFYTADCFECHCEISRVDLNINEGNYYALKEYVWGVMKGLINIHPNTIEFCDICSANGDETLMCKENMPPPEEADYELPDLVWPGLA